MKRLLLENEVYPYPPSRSPSKGRRFFYLRLIGMAALSSEKLVKQVLRRRPKKPLKDFVALAFYCLNLNG